MQMLKEQERMLKNNVAELSASEVDFRKSASLAKNRKR